MIIECAAAAADDCRSEAWCVCLLPQTTACEVKCERFDMENEMKQTEDCTLSLEVK